VIRTGTTAIHAGGRHLSAMAVQPASDQVPPPCLYLTAMTYDPGNGMPVRTRWGIIALVRIEDEGSGVILPHERTFSAHKEDRLKLYRACGAQFSQIFGLYDDPENVVLNACRGSADLTPQMDFQLADGTRHLSGCWRTGCSLKRWQMPCEQRPSLLPTGITAMKQPQLPKHSAARHGRRPANKSYEFVMMYLSNMRDEGPHHTAFPQNGQTGGRF
jgi:hypothetical protein